MSGARRVGLRALAAAALALAGAAGAAAQGAPAPVAVERLADDRVRLDARAAPREAVLDALARAAGVEVAEGAGRPAPRTLTLELPDATLEEALAQVLAGVPYHLHYAAGEPDGAVALRRVTVGLLPEPSAADPAPAAVPGPARARHAPGREAAPAAVRGDAERRDRLAALRDARSEADRAEAASLMRPSEELPALLAYLRDPSAQVRAAATVSLGGVEFGEDAFRVADALVGALDDPDPAVVAAAVEALEAVYDLLPHPRIRAAVARLASAGDPDVRAAVESFREWTEEAP